MLPVFYVKKLCCSFLLIYIKKVMLFFLTDLNLDLKRMMTMIIIPKLE